MLFYNRKKDMTDKDPEEKITHEEIEDEDFKEKWFSCLEAYVVNGDESKPAVLPKITRAYTTSEGSYVYHTSALVLGEDFSKIVIGNAINVTVEEEEYFYKFFTCKPEDLFVLRNNETNGGFCTTITNREELLPGEDLDDEVEEGS